ncbi:hypothetical protein VIGAN_01446800 [Vigna angularis var. angularis]|uniref:Uncharacterized protein n=1 Tax=Vigna angularis var. angularis TaxID=157739 RepID=A0A0S3R762_PHAAN|nr:hypothetical protein VIGAN_01446800 [Vigna angularis var. angularis]
MVYKYQFEIYGTMRKKVVKILLLLFHQYIISNYLIRKVKRGPWKKDVLIEMPPAAPLAQKKLFLQDKKSREIDILHPHA